MQKWVWVKWGGALFPSQVKGCLQWPSNIALSSCTTADLLKLTASLIKSRWQNADTVHMHEVSAGKSMHNLTHQQL